MPTSAPQDRMADAFKAFPPILKDALLTFGREQDAEQEPSALFERFATHHVLRAIGLDAFDATKALVGGENDSQIDAIAITVNGTLVETTEQLDNLAAAAADGAQFDLALTFVQATMSYKFPAEKIALYILGIQNFFLDVSAILINEEVRHALVLKQHAFALYERLSQAGKVRCQVFAVWPGTWTTDGHAEHSTAVAEAGLKTLELARVAVAARFHRLDGTELAKLVHAEQMENNGEIVVAGLVPLPPIPGVDFAALGYVKAMDLLATVTDSDPRTSRAKLLDTVFYGNVRAFLGMDAKSPVNQRMAATLSEEGGARRAEFVLRNNGVTILARQAYVDGEWPTLGARLKLIDFHIVNGSQTTHTLFNCRGQLDDSVLVPIKIIATADEVIGREAVLGLNRQTPINEIQILARNEFVGRIKRHLDLTRSHKSYWLAGKAAPLIMFERRTGEYRTVTQSEARLRVISIEELMQAYAAAFLDVPHRVHRENLEFLEKQVPESIFNEAHDISFYYCAALLLWRARQHFRSREAWRDYPAKHQLVYALRLLTEAYQCPQGRRDGEAHEYLKDLRWRLLGDERWSVAVEQAVALVQDAARDLDNRRKENQVLETGRTADAVRVFVDVTAELARLAEMTKAVRVRVLASRAGP